VWTLAVIQQRALAEDGVTNTFSTRDARAQEAESDGGQATHQPEILLGMSLHSATAKYLFGVKYRDKSMA
jgi:hypothetical protein